MHFKGCIFIIIELSYYLVLYNVQSTPGWCNIVSDVFKPSKRKQTCFIITRSAPQASERSPLKSALIAFWSPAVSLLLVICRETLSSCTYNFGKCFYEGVCGILYVFFGSTALVMFCEDQICRNNCRALSQLCK
jgi:hypothetical protein